MKVRRGVRISTERHGEGQERRRGQGQKPAREVWPRPGDGRQQQGVWRGRRQEGRLSQRVLRQAAGLALVRHQGALLSRGRAGVMCPDGRMTSRTSWTDVTLRGGTAASSSPRTRGGGPAETRTWRWRPWTMWTWRSRCTRGTWAAGGCGGGGVRGVVVTAWVP